MKKKKRIQITIRYGAPTEWLTQTCDNKDMISQEGSNEKAAGKYKNKINRIKITQHIFHRDNFLWHRMFKSSLLLCLSYANSCT